MIVRHWDRSTGQPSGWYGPVKRSIDVVGAVALLTLLWPVMLAIAIAIRLDSPGPALFRQRRTGRRSSEFTIYKFRTMSLGTPDVAAHLLQPQERQVTRVGRVLRRTSIDELPQLINILVGDMSMVGPRPALFNQDDLIAMRRQAHVDLLRPGVTGLAQVHGRDELDLDQKVSYDRRYLEECSIQTDVAIIVRTFAALVSSRGTN